MRGVMLGAFGAMPPACIPYRLQTYDVNYLNMAKTCLKYFKIIAVGLESLYRLKHLHV
jgi:hypothetical protein